eukprot:1358157-Amorphochlora_amoeboformis.AAC.1
MGIHGGSWGFLGIRGDLWGFIEKHTSETPGISQTPYSRGCRLERKVNDFIPGMRILSFPHNPNASKNRRNDLFNLKVLKASRLFD